MTKVNYEVKGVDKLIKKLKKFGDEAMVMVDGVTEQSANTIATNAKAKAPIDTGKLRQTIAVAQPIEAKNQPTYTVYANMPYAAYVEFGTGTKVDVPPELYDLAIRFKGKGIREVNLPARPFLYPSYKAEIPLYKDNLEKLLKRYAKDVSG